MENEEAMAAARALVAAAAVDWEEEWTKKERDNTKRPDRFIGYIKFASVAKRHNFVFYLTTIIQNFDEI